MKNYLLDVETVPASEEVLEKHMPKTSDVPFMEPEEPNWKESVPKYGGDEVKQETWMKEKKEKWQATVEQDRLNHQLRKTDNRQKFIDNAALSAQTCEIKLLGLKEGGINDPVKLLVANATDKERKRIMEGKYIIPINPIFMPEMECLRHFAAFCKKMNEHATFDESGKHEVAPKEGRLVTFWGDLFDLPMIFRRSWMMGIKPPYLLRKGRYFDDRYHVDLASLWQLGDRQEKIGGLDGLAKSLGVQTKSGDGSGFWRMWRDDPAIAVDYHLQDLVITEGCAERMGVL